MDSLQIRTAKNEDRDAIWAIFLQIVERGDTYAFDPAISKQEALAYWMSDANRIFVAERENRVVGTYILRPNQPGLGSHVANAAFMVEPQRSGVGRKMGEHALATAASLGYRAMQFNFVVSTNARAIALWQKLGFEIVGRLPGAFRHRELGYVDALVMYRVLSSND
jgi:ribosomal protein S18 acetylase RimI-like enzyme